MYILERINLDVEMLDSYKLDHLVAKLSDGLEDDKELLAEVKRVKVRLIDTWTSTRFKHSKIKTWLDGTKV
jgi:hypothetical protein